jgi:hypothetical protein
MNAWTEQNVSLAAVMLSETGFATVKTNKQ